MKLFASKCAFFAISICSFCFVPALSLEAKPERKLSSIDDIKQLNSWGTEDQADWTRGYDFLVQELSRNQSYELGADWTYEYELLGLGVSELKSKFPKTTEKLSASENGVQRFSPNEGLAFLLKCENGKIVSVQKHSGGCQSSSIGPWISDLKEGLLRAEMDISKAVALYFVDRMTAPPPTKGDVETRLHWKSIYLKRAQIRHQLQQDEFAVEDLLTLIAIPIWSDQKSTRTNN